MKIYKEMGQTLFKIRFHIVNDGVGLMTVVQWHTPLVLLAAANRRITCTKTNYLFDVKRYHNTPVLSNFLELLVVTGVSREHVEKVAGRWHLYHEVLHEGIEE